MKRNIAFFFLAATPLLLFNIFGLNSGAAQKTNDQEALQHEVSVILKLVQVYVADKNGKPVTELERSDFELYDNGEKDGITDGPGARDEAGPRSGASVRVLMGFDDRKPAALRGPGADGVIGIDIQELERVAIGIGPTSWDEPPKEGPSSAGGMLPAASYAGFMKIGDEWLPLPIGSTFDSARGGFYWMPGPGFLGTYDFVFLIYGGKPTKANVRITISPKRNCPDEL